jgi:hypothetical protein
VEAVLRLLETIGIGGRVGSTVDRLSGRTIVPAQSVAGSEFAAWRVMQQLPAVLSLGRERGAEPFAERYIET